MKQDQGIGLWPCGLIRQGTLGSEERKTRCEFWTRRTGELLKESRQCDSVGSGSSRGLQSSGPRHQCALLKRPRHRSSRRGSKLNGEAGERASPLLTPRTPLRAGFQVP